MDLLGELKQVPFSYYILLSAFVLVAAWESIQPARTPSVSAPLRWLNNLLWLALNGFIVRTVFPILTVAWSVIVAERGWGLLRLADLPVWLAFLIGLTIFDLASYALHVLLHKSSLLWRVHAVHHSDIDFDCTTGFRHHPLEGVLSTGMDIALVTAFGISPAVIVTYDFWLGLQNLYGHANSRLPACVERILRWIVVTPDMHRVHHSVRISESLRNYGIVFPWWDRLFATYQESPEGGHEAMEIGLDWLRGETRWGVPKLLLHPFSVSFPPSRIRYHEPR